SLTFTLIPSFIVIIFSLLLLSFGFFFVHSSSSAWVTRHAMEAKASASGLYLTSYYIGGSIGSIYYGFLWPMYKWPGVIVGSLFILLITSIFTFLLFRIEKREKVLL